MKNYADPTLDTPVRLRSMLLAAAFGYVHFALGTWLFDPQHHFGLYSALYASFFLLLGVSAWACIRYVDPRLDARLPLWWRAAVGSGLLALAAVASFALVYDVAFPLLFGRPPRRSLFMTGLFPTLAALLVYVWLVLDRGAAQQDVETVRLQLEADNLVASLAMAEQSMLDAQIEPHFLFNTLAHVKRQYRVDPAHAAYMLDALIDYLAHAVPALRHADWRIDNELELIQRYLDILARRFGPRLQFSICASEQVRSTPLPALTVATLVENAVRHGLTPKAEGGRITITVVAVDDAVLIQVGDDGVGLRHGSGNGLGLAAVRARLRGAFGAHGKLQVEPAAAGGVLASVRVPCAAAHA